LPKSIFFRPPLFLPLILLTTPYDNLIQNPQLENRGRASFSSLLSLPLAHQPIPTTTPFRPTSNGTFPLSSHSRFILKSVDRWTDGLWSHYNMISWLISLLCELCANKLVLSTALHLDVLHSCHRCCLNSLICYKLFCASLQRLSNTYICLTPFITTLCII